MGCNPEFITGDMKVQEGAYLAVGLVGRVRAGIVKKLVIPAGRRNRCPQGIEDAHPGDDNPFMIVSIWNGSLQSMAKA